MRDNKMKNNIIIVGLCAVLLIMAVGYAAFYSQLKISGTSTITSIWDVEITNIETKNIIGFASNKIEPTYTKLAATFNTNLVSPSDSITYDITVENKGNVDAELKAITKTDISNSAILFETSGLKEGETLQAGKSAVLTVKVTYNSNVTSQPDNLASTLKVTLNYIQKSNSVSPSDGITSSDLIANTVTSNDGLYSDETIANRYVYKGTNPNNYITIGTDTYRIISIESDRTLKVIKNEIIGNYSFDASGSRYSQLNEDYCNSTSGCKVWGNKNSMLDSSLKNITSMPKYDTETETYALSDKEASLNIYLNDTWFNNLSSSVQDIIVNHLFNVGMANYYEKTLTNTISQENLFKWKGKVGLMNVSDYVKANSNMNLCGTVYDNTYSARNYSTCISTNWIYNSIGNSYLWTITSHSNSYAQSMLCISGEGAVFSGRASDSDGVAPVFYLSSDITLTGEGTSSNPYTVM